MPLQKRHETGNSSGVAPKESWGDTGKWFTHLLNWATSLLGLALGIVYGSKFMGLDLFVVVRPSLPPPWRWLPLDFSTYSYIYNCLHIVLMLFLLASLFFVSRFRPLLARICLLTGSAAAVSVMVVEGLGVREGPRAVGIELLFYSGLAFGAIVVIEVLFYFSLLALFLWFLRRFTLRFARRWKA